MSQEYADAVRALIMEQLGVDDAGRVTPRSRLAEDLGAGPLELLELLAAVEEEFDLEIPDEDAQGLITVGDVVAYLEDRLTRARAATA
jgi:acyl carrier protein